MAYIWSADLETGNFQIDTEHKSLIKAINDLLSACGEGKGRAEVEKTINFLASYTKTHFQHEEQLQIASKYPDFVNHKRYHESFIKVVDEIKAKLLAGGATIVVVGEVNQRVGDWLINHIKKEDVKVAAHIKNAKK